MVSLSVVSENMAKYKGLLICMTQGSVIESSLFSSTIFTMTSFETSESFKDLGKKIIKSFLDFSLSGIVFLLTLSFRKINSRTS